MEIIYHKQTERLHYVLRIVSAMCFIGHGIFGVITKEIWTHYFAVFGIGHSLSYSLMPVIGIVDILFGISLLVYPTRAVLLWLICWGFVTASLRPLSGEPFAELIERAGNYGAPLALLLLSGFPRNFKDWFKCITVAKHNLLTASHLKLCLRLIVFLLLLGHGWLNLIEKKGLLDQYASLGFANPLQAANIIGYIEITAAFLVLIKPLRPILAFLFIWKVTSELFYPHYEAFEWIERAGSYGCLLALWMLSSPEKYALNFRRLVHSKFYSAIRSQRVQA